MTKAEVRIIDMTALEALGHHLIFMIDSCDPLPQVVSWVLEQSENISTIELVYLIEGAIQWMRFNLMDNQPEFVNYYSFLINYKQQMFTKIINAR